MFTRATTSLFAGVAIGALSVGGVAAAATSSGKQVTMCAAKSSGDVRLAKKCAKTETALVLGQIGPRGLTGKTGKAGNNGAAGAPGAPGPTGQTGPSDLYTYSYSNSQPAASAPPDLGGAESPTLLTLPAGSYEIRSRLQVLGSPGTSPGYAYCTVHLHPAVGGVLAGAQAAAQVYAGTAYSLAEGTSDDTVTLPATTTVTVICGMSGTPRVGVTGWSVSALRVGAAHLTGFTPA